MPFLYNIAVWYWIFQLNPLLSNPIRLVCICMYICKTECSWLYKDNLSVCVHRSINSCVCLSVSSLFIRLSLSCAVSPLYSLIWVRLGSGYRYIVFFAVFFSSAPNQYKMQFKRILRQTSQFKKNVHIFTMFISLLQYFLWYSICVLFFFFFFVFVFFFL